MSHSGFGDDRQFIEAVARDPALLNQAIGGLAEYLRLAGAGDPRLDPRVNAPGGASANYFDFLSNRLMTLRSIQEVGVLGPEAFQTPDARAALEAAFRDNPFAGDALAAALRGDSGVRLEGPGPGVGTAAMMSTMENVMVPPAPDMGGVWDSRTSAGDVDASRAFNEPIRIGVGQSPLAYSSPFIAAPVQSAGGNNSMLTLFAIAGLALALWR